MLQTVRAFAGDELRLAGEDDDVRLRHARHYSGMAEEVSVGLRNAGRAASVVVQRATLEHDNFREALAWALGDRGDRQSTATPVSPEIAQRLAARLAIFCRMGGYLAEGTRWVGLAISAGEGRESPDAARCLQAFGYLNGMAGDAGAAIELTAAATDMARRLDDPEVVAGALIALAEWERTRGEVVPARQALKEAADISRSIGDDRALAQALAVHADVEAQDEQWNRSLELSKAALTALGRSDNGLMRTLVSHNMAATLLEIGRAEEAEEIVRADLPAVVGWGLPGVTIETAEIYAPVLIELGRPRPAAVLVGAADAARGRNAFPRHPLAQAELDQPVARARDELSENEWEAAYDEGTRMPVEDALRLAAASPA
jgi:hypothetical protein